MRHSISQLIELCSREDLKRVKWLFLLTLIMGVLEVAGLASVIPFLQLASQPDSFQDNTLASSFFSALDINGYTAQLVFTGWCVLIFLALSNMINAFSGWTIQRIGWTLSHQISMRLVTRYLAMPYEFFLNKEIAEITKSTVADVNNLVNNVLIASCKLLTSLAVIVLVITLLAIIQPVVALSSVLFFGFAFISIFFLKKTQISDLGRRQLIANTGRYTTFLDLLNGIKAIQSSNSHQYFFNRFDEPSNEYSMIQPKLFISSVLPKYLIETLVFGSIIMVIIHLTKNNQSFSDYLPLISLYAVAGYRLLPLINSAYTSAIQILSNYHVIDSIHKDYVYGDTRDSTVSTPLPYNEVLKLNNISFCYAGATRNAVDNISLTINKGSKVALVGTSGSGKSTLGSLLVGLIKPMSGVISIDGIERTNDHQSDWTDQVGYVPQDVFLFSGSVTENVCFGLPENQSDVVAACKIAQIHDHIVGNLSEGYASVVGDNGIRLSGGQRQRIGLARAIYRNPKLLLLDEATSALDTKTEKRIFEAIHAELSHLTLVVIAHRVSTVKTSDQIFVLEEGSLVAQGTFDELIGKSSLFQELSSYI